MCSLLLTAVLFSLSFSIVKAGLPERIMGTNIGSWLIVEPWMHPKRWLEMGGENCDSCSNCIGTEFSFVKAHGQNYSDEMFNDHWTTWFAQDDVNQLKELGINTARVGVPFWVVEDLVDRDTEYFPRGGLLQLRRGLQQLKDANISAIIDHHVVPGAAVAKRPGQCTDTPTFYTPKNYQRALVWTAVMTTLSHLDPAFGSVGAIGAVNEPDMDAKKTPGYGDFQKDFVKVIRAVENVLFSMNGSTSSQQLDGTDITSALSSVSGQPTEGNTPEVLTAILAAVPILMRITKKLSLEDILHFSTTQREPLVTMFMDINWQSNSPPNPADAADGPQLYDNHLFYGFGGVANPNEEEYMISICNLRRIENDRVLGNTPLVFGTWSLITQFNASDMFLRQFADAQKWQYSRGAGWIYWNFKMEISELTGDKAKQWSYFEGVKRGYFTKDPYALNDPHVCEPYTISKSYTPPVPTSTASSSVLVGTISQTESTGITVPSSASTYQPKRGLGLNDPI